MIRTIIDFIGFINSLSGFLVALLFWSILTTTFAGSIKKHARLLYWMFGIMGALSLLPILNVFGMDMMSIIYLPVIGDIFIEFTYATYFIHPMLVIIMYMGALSLKIPAVGKLMLIRKELSIIVGFAVIPHALKRIISVVPGAWKYFADHDTLVAQDKVVSALGQGITNAVFLLGIVMTVLFLVLWVTSFDRIRKKMGYKKWKSVQRWSYALYAMLFIHSTGIDAGSLVTYWERQEKMAKAEVVAAPALQNNGQSGSDQTPHAAFAPLQKREKASFLGMSMKEEKGMEGGNHNFMGKFKFSNVEFSTPCKCIANILILISIYGSYLYLRLKKAITDKARKQR